MNQCRHCIHPLTQASDDRGRFWVHQATGVTRCPEQHARRAQVAEPTSQPIARTDVALAGGF